MEAIVKKDITILFAGDSGDGIQLTGGQFTNTTALYGNDISTFPDFPAEIRAPQGTLAGVSGFQLKFGSNDVHTPGDECDVLVVMNAASLKMNINSLKQGGILIVNSSGFVAKNLTLADYSESPLEDGSLAGFELFSIDVTKLTREALKDQGMGQKEIDRSKNMFVLGFMYWMFNRNVDRTVDFLTEKFKNRPEISNANIKVLKAGYHFGETTETNSSRYEVQPAKLNKGEYRNISGNEAISIGLITGAHQSNLKLFYGSYPITPASSILHELSKHKNHGVITFQAEDEIAAICAAIGASYGGALGVTGSSGPGIALKGEAIGLATIFEIPLVVVNIQRGGPSTGLPTKTEQADLFQAMYGRNGESSIPVIAAKSPSDCFDAAIEACRISIEHMIPVLLLSDGYIANGSEPWRFPSTSDLPKIKPPFVHSDDLNGQFLPYKRNENHIRQWAIPGMPGFEHRIGGLEKEVDTGNVSYDPDNHQKMVQIRQEKVDKIADLIPEQVIDQGRKKGDLLIIGWGSTYGVIKTAVTELRAEGMDVSHAHITYLNPFPKNLDSLLKSFKKVIVTEMNNGQLVQLLRSKYLVDAEGFLKIKGIPFTSSEIKEKIKSTIPN